jgi:Protein of unknown function (DUF2865)
VHRPNPDHALSWAVALGLALVLTASAVGPASAQNLLSAIFGALTGRPPERSASPTTAYADPNHDRRDVFRRPSAQAPSGGSLGYAAYCVRLCDGRYFPIPRYSSASPAQLCSAMCPAAKTKIFAGNEIARAVAPDGSRYEDLDEAFTYRERLVDNCTCNGKDAVGLAPVDVNSDPTLRAGDIVATKTGLAAFTGASRTRRNETAANFTPINAVQLSREMKDRLANVTVAKQN